MTTQEVGLLEPRRMKFIQIHVYRTTVPVISILCEALYLATACALIMAPHFAVVSLVCSSLAEAMH